MLVNWQDVVTNVGTTLVSGGVVVGAAAWIVKTGITKKLTRDLEAFKTRLTADADIEIERLKSSLQVTMLEHQVRFSKLHEKRAEVIAELYARIVRLFWNSRRFVLTSEYGSSPSQQEEYGKAQTEIWDFVVFAETNQIYLPDRVYASLETFIDPVKKAVIKAGIYGRIQYPNEQERRKIEAAFTQAYEAFDKEIPAAKRMLEGEFRVMLGVVSGNT